MKDKFKAIGFGPPQVMCSYVLTTKELYASTFINIIISNPIFLLRKSILKKMKPLKLRYLSTKAFFKIFADYE